MSLPVRPEDRREFRLRQAALLALIGVPTVHTLVAFAHGAVTAGCLSATALLIALWLPQELHGDAPHAARRPLRWGEWIDVSFLTCAGLLCLLNAAYGLVRWLTPGVGESLR